jgi:hypothetical protein
MQEKPSEQKLTTRYPLDVFKDMKRLAKEHNRSFNGEVIWALREYIRQYKEAKA